MGGPGLKKQPIPANMLSHVGEPMRPLGDEPFTLVEAKVQMGVRMFMVMGCASCHELGHGKPAVPSMRSAKPLAELNPLAGDGRFFRFGGGWVFR